MARIRGFGHFVTERNTADSLVLCPCTRCLNHKLVLISEQKQHLLLNKFSSTYLLWTHHGEPEDAMIIINDQNDADDDDDDVNGGHADHNNDNGGHKDDNDGTGGQDVIMKTRQLERLTNLKHY